MKNIKSFKIFESERSHKHYVCKIENYSIYHSDSGANQDNDRFTVHLDGKQVYDTQNLSGAISHALGDRKPTKTEIKKWKQLCKKFDRASENDIDKLPF